MRYITSIERLGREEGHKEGQANALKVVLEARFQPLSLDLSRKLDSLSAQQLQPLLPLAATVESLEEFVAQMRTSIRSKSRP